MSESSPGRIALVTGASRGIGREIALELGRRGSDVVLADLEAGPAEAAAAEIQAMGRRAMTLSLDVADLAAVEGAAAQIDKTLGKVSILVNNAGITRDQLLLRMKAEDWTRVMRVNLDGTFFCTKVFVKDMLRARWGRVVNISSVVGKIGNAGQANYAASKAGVVGFTRSVAREVAGRNVTVNAVAPGFIETAMTDALSEDVKKSLLGSVPLGRLGTAGDVAKAVAFLCSEESAYITGQLIHVDGGMVMA